MNGFYLHPAWPLTFKHMFNLELNIKNIINFISQLDLNLYQYQKLTYYYVALS